MKSATLTGNRSRLRRLLWARLRRAERQYMTSSITQPVATPRRSPCSIKMGNETPKAANSSIAAAARPMAAAVIILRTGILIFIKSPRVWNSIVSGTDLR
ncbi:MAG: hypothetical protein ACYSTT_25695 [Planctomycetota bacterium]